LCLQHEAARTELPRNESLTIERLFKRESCFAQQSLSGARSLFWVIQTQCRLADPYDLCNARLFDICERHALDDLAQLVRGLMLGAPDGALAIAIFVRGKFIAGAQPIGLAGCLMSSEQTFQLLRLDCEAPTLSKEQPGCPACAHMPNDKALKRKLKTKRDKSSLRFTPRR
jgi:hypothetical protein